MWNSECFTQTCFRDYLGALQCYRPENPTDFRILSLTSFLIDSLRQAPASRGPQCPRTVPILTSTQRQSTMNRNPNLIRNEVTP